MSPCDKFTMYKNNCNLVFIFTKRRRRQKYVIVLKQKINGSYSKILNKWVINSNTRSLINFINTQVNTQFSNALTFGSTSYPSAL